VHGMTTRTFRYTTIVESEAGASQDEEDSGYQ
jgi:hypothetical protein